MLNVEIVPPTGDDHDKRTLGDVVYMRTPIRISWENEGGFVERMFGGLYGSTIDRATRTMVP